MSDQPNVSKEEHQEDNQQRAPKRARTSASSQSAPKKRVKGRQGGLQGIMKMPIEIFMEIAPYVNPGDLVSLIRTSKFFRGMLLDRSAVLVWQRSLNNVPDLPPCPTGMVEPQYAALMFTKNCTICGAQAVSSKLDPYLRVRLCRSCRDRELTERSPYFFYPGSGNTIPFTLLIKKFRKSYHKNPAYLLRVQEQEYERKKMEFISKGDNEGRNKWQKEQLAAWETQQKEGDGLLEYINSVAESRSSELHDTKVERREQIHERLKTLGWDEKYFEFWRGSDSARKQWHSLLEAPKPLTERTWTNIVDKLTQLLEENRPQIDEHERKGRLRSRLTCLQDLLRKLNARTNPHRAIVGALQQPLGSTGLLKINHPSVMLDPPFPSECVLAGWDSLTDLYMEEHSTERVEELFNERQKIIGQQLSEWRTKVEDHLVEQYTSSFAEGTNSRSTILTIKGSPDSTKDLSENTRFLLRADTVFMKAGIPTCYIEVDQEHGPVCNTVHFPDISPIQNYAVFYHDEPVPDLNKDTRELEPYVRHAGKEAIIKALLRELGMPDVSHVELVQMGGVFVCGRCNLSQAMEWHEIVSHYHLKRREWVGGRYVHSDFTTKHPVVIRSAHDLAPGISSRPLVHIGTSIDTVLNTVARCLICHKFDPYVGARFDSLERLKEHMVEIHDAPEPVEGLHFLPESRFMDMFQGGFSSHRGDWEERWDEYYNAQSASNSADR
ncbi:hypothetical protein RSOL_016740 [Rhizoctonia solani AG-3 Rhs1AP]|uniref:F-box domain-containing protein n=1 Tax=Rhizoctonia solani AG-3 Rhs1AP TaxID=1086054 RepID=X8IXK2_9AGAM|nr:hypothetical protein RSOL_016740 [Rhizoctonia solani AG-3 Rhs1AP]